MQGDPNFHPANKGEFAIDPRGYPKLHRMVAGRVVVEEITPRPKDDYNDISELLAGVSTTDLRGRASGFGRHVVANYRDAAAGSGDPDDRQHRRSNMDYQNDLGGQAPLDQGWQTTEDPGEADLFDQPADAHERTEYGDFLQEFDDEEHAAPGAEVSFTSPNQFDEEDIWNMDVFDEFDEDRKREFQPDAPTFSGRPHRQMEAMSSSTDDLADELNDMFGGASSFTRRGF